jgi:hypothetical protein
MNREDAVKNFCVQICAGLLLTITTTALAQAQPAPQPPAGTGIPVTADNFVRAETDKIFASFEKQNAFSKFLHFRTLSPIDNHTVQRGNRDTLYSVGVFDLDAGPVTISLPDAGKRFMTMIVIDEDHYVFTVVYGQGRHTLSRTEIGTRYALAAIRHPGRSERSEGCWAGQCLAG